MTKAKLQSLWESNYDLWFLRAVDEIGRTSPQYENYGDSTCAVAHYLDNEEEVREKTEEMIEKNFEDFKDTYGRELCQILMPKYNTMEESIEKDDAMYDFLEKLDYEQTKYLAEV